LCEREKKPDRLHTADKLCIVRGSIKQTRHEFAHRLVQERSEQLGRGQGNSNEKRRGKEEGWVPSSESRGYVFDAENLIPIHVFEHVFDVEYGRRFVEERKKRKRNKDEAKSRGSFNANASWAQRPWMSFNPHSDKPDSAWILGT
jgi:hypothetical protein